MTGRTQLVPIETIGGTDSVRMRGWEPVTARQIQVAPLDPPFCVRIGFVTGVSDAISGVSELRFQFPR